MADVQTTGTATLSAEIRQHYDLTLLHIAVPQLVHGKFAKQFKIPKGEGQVINWRRFSLLAAATTPLTEGVTPAGNVSTVINISASVSQYGDYIVFSDIVTVTSIDNLLMENSEILGQQAGNTFDQLTRTAMNAGTNVRYANGRVSRVTVAAGDVVTDTEIKKLRRTLKAQNTETIKTVYPCIVHPNTFYDLQSTNGFLNTGFYSDPQKIYSGDVIKLYGIMFMETTNANVFSGAGAGGIDVYSSVAFGMEAVGVVDIDSLGLRTIYHPLGHGDDPLEQRQSQAWKGMFAAAILNQNYICRLEHAVTA